MSKKIFIKTFGCQMNEYDSNRIIDTVKEIGFKKTDNLDQADCFILNTCHIRDKAKEKVYHEIGRVRQMFKSKNKPLVIVAGCVAQAENEVMLKREPYIDLIIGPQSYHKLNNQIENYLNKQKKIPQILKRMQFPCSDALSYSHLAEGKLDIVIQCGNKIWDIHPLIPIIKAAGGIVTTWKNKDPKKAGNIICSANKSLHNKILKILKPVSK